MSDARWEDKLAIREVIDKWVIFSDAGFWDDFANTWHDGADMSATWKQASAQDFTAGRREGWERGVSIIHFLGGTTIELAGDRAIAQTKMTISQRAPVHDVLVDVVCTGRFYDFFEKRAERWAIVHRRCIYEKDRMDAVSPGARLELDTALLDSFPQGYKHLAYLQTQIGYQIKGEPRPELKGAAVEALYARGRAWLDGGDPFAGDS